MKLLLDTCTFLWLNGNPARVPAPIRKLCDNAENELFLSVASSWEIILKNAAGHLPLPESAAQYIPARRELNGIAALALDESSLVHLPKLPSIHADPFDRILICQAIQHDLTILTPDPQISRYPIRVLW